MHQPQLPVEENHVMIEQDGQMVRLETSMSKLRLATTAHIDVYIVCNLIEVSRLVLFGALNDFFANQCGFPLDVHADFKVRFLVRNVENGLHVQDRVYYQDRELILIAEHKTERRFLHVSKKASEINFILRLFAGPILKENQWNIPEGVASDMAAVGDGAVMQNPKVLGKTYDFLVNGETDTVSQPTSVPTLH